MPTIEIRDDDGNTVTVNTETGGCVHEPADIFQKAIELGVETFFPLGDDK